MGVAIGVAIEAVLSPEAAARLTTGSPWLAIPVASAMGTPLYFSTELFVPIANPLHNAGVGVGAIVALTISGAGANPREVPTPPTLTPPAASLPDGMPSDYGLILGESRLTVFTTAGSPLGHDRVDGITFELRRVGDIKYLVVDEPNFACGPPETDRFAIEFDRPVEERSDP